VGKDKVWLNGAVLKLTSMASNQLISIYLYNAYMQPTRCTARKEEGVLPVLGTVATTSSLTVEGKLDF